MKYEWIGILGSVMIIIAFTNKNEVAIRILDGIGALLFVVYGLFLHAWSTVFLNVVLIGVHVVRFINMKQKGESHGERTKPAEGG